jgi:uncharacterized protein YfaS (alpha-2-macroglobulin family)
MTEHVIEELVAYLDGALAPTDAERVKAHLDGCESCRAELARAQALRADLVKVFESRMSRVRLNGAATERLRTRLEAEQNQLTLGKLLSRLGEFFRPLVKRRYALAQATLALLVLLFALAAWNATTMTARADDQETIVLGQDQFAPGSPASVRVVVRSVRTGDPVAGADVNVTLQSNTAPVTYQGKTDVTGSANVQLNVPASADGKATLVVETRSSLGQDRVVQPIEIKRSFKVFLSTDKPVYQPGQMIHLRALALDAFDRHAIANQPVEFIVSNPNGDKVFRQKVTTSSFGIASADFQLDSQIVTGKYNLQAVLGDTTSERTVEVKPYVLPKFKVDIQTDRPYYQPGARVTGDVQADYFFGKPTSDARVELRGYTNDPNRRQTVEIFGQTNPQGRFHFEFNLPPLAFAGDKSTATFDLEVAVIDQAEHREELGQSLTIARDPLVIDAVAESGTLRPGVENIVYILVSTPDGRPARAAVTVNGQALQAGEFGLAEYHFTPAPSQGTSLDISAQDNTGASARRTINLQADRGAGTILLRTERAGYRVGDTLKAEALTTVQSGAVFLDIVKDRQTIAAFSLPIKQGKAQFAVDLDAAMFGTLELHAYIVLPDAGIARDTRLVVVDQAQDLTIGIGADRQTYRPGDTAKLAMTTTLQSGQGVPAALGLGIVDESVYAVQDQAPGFARLYFLLEKELLEPKVDVSGFDVPTLLTPPNAAVQQVQDQAAKASWAGSPFTQFAYDLRTRMQKLSDLANQKVKAFIQLSGTLSRTLIVVPALALIVLIWGLRATRVLSKAVSSTIRWTALGLLFSPIAVCLMVYVLTILQIVSLAVLAALGAAALWLGAWLALAIYAWSKNDARTQLVAGLCMAYTLLGALMVFVAESGGDPKGSTIAWLFGSFLLMILILVALGQGLRYEGRRRAAWAATFVGLLWIPLVVSGAMATNVTSHLLGTIGNPIAYTGALGWLTGCAGAPAATPAPAPTQPAAKAAATSAPAALPTKAAAPTAAPAVQPPEAPKPAGQAAPAEPVRLRQFFPETMYWNPEAITDKDGRLKLDVPLADSITTWRLTALASTQNGQIGSQTYGLRVFQDFFIDLDLPVQLTVGDEVAVPVAVYNYLTQTQQVRLEITRADWFELMDDPAKTISIAPNDIDVVYFRIQAKQFGVGRLTVTGRGSVMSDAIAKDVTVVPNGSPVRTTKSDYLSANTEATIAIPAQAIQGTARIEVKLYAGPSAQIVEGLDALLRMPNGCFEQTSSTLYPDILILDYLNRTKRAAPEVQMKATSFIAAGYQRLLTYEVKGGGFSLFGNPPATLMHTAYGLMEFSDMSKVYPVDRAIIERTARWLLAQQGSDGAWGGQGVPGQMESWNSLRNSKLPMTAYITWALVESGYLQESGTQRAFNYLRAHWSEAEDAYTLALAANALVSAQDSAARPALDKLASLATRDNDTARWTARTQSFTGASGNVADLETTALAAQALLRGKSNTSAAQAALKYLTRAKDSFGTWESTQATILALKAFLASFDAGPTQANATVEVLLNGGQAHTLRITPENADVVHILAFGDDVRGGDNRISLRLSGQNTENLVYQVTAQSYVPWVNVPPVTAAPIDIHVDYDNTQLYVGDEMVATVAITLNQKAKTQWAIVDLGVPPGFEVVTEDLDNLIRQSADLPTKVRRYELTGKQIIVYMENLEYKISFGYRLRAKLPLKAQVPSSVVYDYYNPEVSGSLPPSLVTVETRP